MAHPNAVQCPHCEEETTTLRGTKLHSLPGVLVVTANRYEMDMTTFDTIKLKDRFEFPLVLDSRPFVPGGAVAEAQEAVGTARSSLYAATLTAGLDSGTVDLLQSVAAAGTKAERERRDEALEALEGDVAAVEEAMERVAEAMRDLRAAESAARDSCVWISALDSEVGRAVSAAVSASHDRLSDAGRRQIYDLFGVVIHHGSSPGSGHYTAYIRDSVGEGRWRPADKPFTLDGKGPGSVFRKGTSGSHAKGGGKGAATGGRDVAGSSAAMARPDMSEAEQAVVLLRAEAELTSPLRPLYEIVHGASGGSISVSEVDKQLKANSGCTYEELYEEEWGALVDFLVCCSKYFVCFDDTVMPMADAEPPMLPEASVAGDSGAPAAAASASASSSGAGAGVTLSEKQRVHAALATQWGDWFAFNDSVVESSTLSDVASTFQGTSCAYLLMYRSRTLANTAAISRKAGETDAAAESAPAAAAAASASTSALCASAAPGSLAPNVAQPTPPPYWVRRITQESEELSRQRRKFDEKVHQMRVWVHTPAMYEPSPGGIGISRSGLDLRDLAGISTKASSTAEVLCKAGITSLRAEGIEPLHGAEDSTEDLGGVPLLIDTRMRAADLCKLILATVGGDAAAPRTLDTLRLNVVRRTVTGAHLYEHLPADPETGAPLLGTELFEALAEGSVADLAPAIGHDTVIIAWNGTDVAGLPVVPGELGEAMTLHCQRLVPAAADPSQPEITPFEVTLPRSCSLDQLRAKARAICPDVDEVSEAVFLVTEVAKGKRKAERVVSKTDPATGGPMSLAKLGMYDGATVMLEPGLTRSGGTRRKFLAADVVRAYETTVCVDVTWNAGGLPKTAFQLATKAGFTAKAEEFHPPRSCVVGVETTTGTSVAELKAVVVKALRVDVSKTGGGGRCRKIMSLIADENVTVAAEGLGSSGLRVEFGAPLEADEMTVQVGLLIGNKRAVRGGGGEVSPWLEVTVRGSTTVAELKQVVLAKAVEKGYNLGPFPSTALVRDADSAAIEAAAAVAVADKLAAPDLLPLSSGLGLRTVLAAGDRRLRSTNGFGEANSDGIFTNELVTLPVAGIAHGDKVLLEEGVPPTPGLETVHFALATPRFGQDVLAALPAGAVPTIADVDFAERSILLADQAAAAAEADAIAAGKGEAAALVARQASRAAISAGLEQHRRSLEEADCGEGTGASAVDQGREGAGGVPLMRVVSASGEGEGRPADALDYMLRVRYASVFALGTLTVEEKMPLEDLKTRLAEWPELAAAYTWYKSPHSVHDPKGSRFRMGKVLPAGATAPEGGASAAPVGAGAAAEPATREAVAPGPVGPDRTAGKIASPPLPDTAVTLESMFPGTDWSTTLRITAYRRGQRLPIGVLLGDKKSLKTHKVNQGLLYVVSVLPAPDPMDGMALPSTWQLHVQHRKPNKAALPDLVRLRDDRQATVMAVAEAEAEADASTQRTVGKGGKLASASKVKWSDPLDFDAQAARAAVSATTEHGILSIAGANEPVWPPETLVFSFGADAAAAAGVPGTKGKPTLSTLLHQLAASSLTRPDTKPTDIRVAKYNPSRKLWIPLAEHTPAIQAPAAGTDEAGASGGGAGAGRGSGRKRGKAKGKAKGKGKGKIPTLRDPPYSVNNGDLIAFCYVDEDPAGADDWMRAEDFAAAVQESEEAAEARSMRATGHTRWAGPGSGAGASRPRRVERALSLGSEDSYILDDEVGSDGDDDDEAAA